MLHRHFSACHEWPTQSYHLLEGFTGSKHRIFPISSLRIGREQHGFRFHKSFVFPENEGNFVENQLLDGSIGLSPLRRRRTICPSIPKRAFARDSPDFAFFRHISRVFSACYSYSNHSQDHGQWQVCMCVCVCVSVSVYVVWCVRVEKHGKPEETERNACGMVCVLCGIVK